MKERQEMECEVCGTPAVCTVIKNGMHVCSRTCRLIAEGNDGEKIPVDVMFRTSAREYVGY